jgi:small-conductance mechanosensitive channel
MFRNTLDQHRLMLVSRGSFYGVLAIFVVTALLEMGFKLGVLLGTAGLITVAIGFAAQTSMSNLISGLFLVAEKPFQVGDVIQVDMTTGVVLSIDLLSVKLRKFDNTFVRVPNELLIKSQVATLTRFPIRRIDIKLSVSLHEDIGRVQQILMDVADKNSLALAEPAPLFLSQGFGEYMQSLQFSVWVLRESYLNVLNSIQAEIKQAFDEAGIKIPVPHRTLFAGSEGEPFSIRLVTDTPQTSREDAQAGDKLDDDASGDSVSE